MWGTYLLSIFIKTSLKTCIFSLIVFLSNAYCQLKFSLARWAEITSAFLWSQTILQCGGGRGILQLIFPYMISWWQLLQTEFSMPESTNMLGFDVKIRSMQENKLFVKWVGLSIIWLQPAVDVMVSSSSPILSLISKEYHFEIFCWNLL